MAVGDAYVFPGLLKPLLTQLFFPRPLTTSLTCFCRGERRKYARKKSRLNQGSNSKPQGHESDTLTTEQPGRSRNEVETATGCYLTETAGPAWLSCNSVGLKPWQSLVLASLDPLDFSSEFPLEAILHHYSKLTAHLEH